MQCSKLQFQLVTGECLRYSRDAEEISPWPGGGGGGGVTLPSVCPWTALVVTEGAAGGGGGGAEHVLGLSSRHRLYRDGEEIAGDVTSFCVHSEFVLVTTLKHTLK